MTGRAVVLRGDARNLPLPDASVDLICTSPPFLNLRSYTDGGTHYDGQIGTGAREQFLDDLWECTAEMARVLKPAGSIFVELGDSYTDKCLNDTPARYGIGCVDKLGLIKRANIVWHHTNGLPESVTDRVRASHSVVFHLVKQPRYYAAVDEIRSPHVKQNLENRSSYAPGSSSGYTNGKRPAKSDAGLPLNPLGKLPGSVWDIPSQPLTVPESLGISHFAAFPMELPRRIILGWSPPGICAACGEGRRPLAVTDLGRKERLTPAYTDAGINGSGRHEKGASTLGSRGPSATITGYACACVPYTDHPGSGKPTRRRDYNPGPEHYNPQGTYGRKQAGEYERVGPWREYHLGDWTPPPARPALVLDPFAGTGTTMLTASVLGRIGVGVDKSMDYARLARWRTQDPGERARALGVPKPPPVPDGQGDLFDLGEVS